MRSLALVLLVSGCVVKGSSDSQTAPPPPPSGGATCNFEGATLRQDSQGACATSEWRIARQPDGSWAATETGCGNATGTAVVAGGSLRIDFTFGGGAGYYEWTLRPDCSGGDGQLVFTGGGMSGQSFGSRLTISGGGGAGAGVTVETITDDQGKQYKIQQGVRGDPAQIGCADGQREAFVDAAAYPRIAGCLSSWDGKKSLRAPQSGRACGDDAGPCAVPGDACGPGWRVCGAGGAIADLRQVSGVQCEQAGGGRFSAAMSHCETQSGCTYDTRPEGDYACFESGWCSEPVCCGSDCGELGACVDGVWPGKTHIAQGRRRVVRAGL